MIVTSNNGRKQTFDVTNAGSYLSSNDQRVLVGIGSATGIQNVEIHWPSGREQIITDPGIDR